MGVSITRTIVSMLALAFACVPASASAQTPKPLSIDVAPVRGSENAKVVIVEFSDFQCPYCGKYARETLAELEETYIATGKVRYVFRNFPLEEAHPTALAAAEAGECARQQGRFWEMHNRLFANQQTLAVGNLTAHARALGLDQAAFEKCLNGPAKAKIQRDFNEGLRAGVSGTPTFFIGTIQRDGKVRVLKTLSGTQTTATFKAALDALLASPDINPPRTQRP